MSKYPLLREEEEEETLYSLPPHSLNLSLLILRAAEGGPAGRGAVANRADHLGERALGEQVRAEEEGAQGYRNLAQ